MGTIWENHQDLYPIPDGFEDSSWGDDAAPSYTGFDGRCIIWMHDQSTMEDIHGLWGTEEGNKRFKNWKSFSVVYVTEGEAYGLGDDSDISLSAGTHTWDHVLFLISLLRNHVSKEV